MALRAPRAEGWKASEDVALCEARLAIGGDPEFGANKKDATLWERIHSHFDSHRPEGSLYREIKSCSTRMKKISKECMIYSASLKMAEAARSSGENYTDTVLLAESNYFKVANRPFKLQHCWALLKDELKFQNPSVGGTISLVDDDTPGSEGGVSSSRPLGQKATKAARRKKDLPSARDNQLEEFINWTKDHEITTATNRAKEFAAAEAAEQRAADDRTMQVDPNIFTSNKRLYWKRKQKVIMNREMVDAFSTPLPEQSSGAARNLFTQESNVPWEDADLKNDF